MVGGVTFSEIRSVYELVEAQGVDAIIGSSSTLTCDQYIEDLSSANDLDEVELDLGLDDD